MVVENGCGKRRGLYNLPAWCSVGFVFFFGNAAGTICCALASLSAVCWRNSAIFFRSLSLYVSRVDSTICNPRGPAWETRPDIDERLEKHLDVGSVIVMGSVMWGDVFCVLFYCRVVLCVCVKWWCFVCRALCVSLLCVVLCVCRALCSVCVLTGNLESFLE